MAERTKTCLEESIALYQAGGNENASGYAWAILFSGYYSDQPQIQIQKALGIFRKTGERHGMAEALMGLALNEIDPVDRRRLHQEHLEIDQANGDTEGITEALWYISLVDCQDAEWKQALQALKASQAHFRRVHNPNMLGMVSVWLAICSVHNGDLPRAGGVVEDVLPPPDQLLLREDGVKVTISLSRKSVDFFKSHAAQSKVCHIRE